VLLLVGEESLDPAKADVESVAGALPDARIVVIPEQQHVANVLAPEIFSGYLVAFFHDQR
jgi:pimeloyl-ACP methyl ester carboxylesterase